MLKPKEGNSKGNSNNNFRIFTNKCKVHSGTGNEGQEGE